MTDDLVDFIRLRLDEDETAARAVIGGRPLEHMRYLTWFQTSEVIGNRNGDVVAYGVKPWAMGHIARQDPARVLREVEGKRRRIADYLEARDAADSLADLPDTPRMRIERAHYSARRDVYRANLELDALPYADHPDFKEHWRP